MPQFFSAAPVPAQRNTVGFLPLYTVQASFSTQSLCSRAILVTLHTPGTNPSRALCQPYFWKLFVMES